MTLSLQTTATAVGIVTATAIETAVRTRAPAGTETSGATATEESSKSPEITGGATGMGTIGTGEILEMKLTDRKAGPIQGMSGDPKGPTENLIGEASTFFSSHYFDLVNSTIFCYRYCERQMILFIIHTKFS